MSNKPETTNTKETDKPETQAVTKSKYYDLLKTELPQTNTKMLEALASFIETLNLKTRFDTNAVYINNKIKELIVRYGLLTTIKYDKDDSPLIVYQKYLLANDNHDGFYLIDKILNQK